jgi:hypothetical protein
METKSKCLCIKIMIGGLFLPSYPATGKSDREPGSRLPNWEVCK